MCNTTSIRSKWTHKFLFVFLQNMYTQYSLAVLNYASSKKLRFTTPESWRFLHEGICMIIKTEMLNNMVKNECAFMTKIQSITKKVHDCWIMRCTVWTVQTTPLLQFFHCSGNPQSFKVWSKLSSLYVQNHCPFVPREYNTQNIHLITLLTTLSCSWLLPSKQNHCYVIPGSLQQSTFSYLNEKCLYLLLNIGPPRPPPPRPRPLAAEAK